MKTFALSLLKAALLLFAAQHLAGAELVLQAPDEIIRDYPIPLRVTVPGPAEVERLSLSESAGTLQLMLQSEENGARYAFTMTSRAAIDDSGPMIGGSVVMTGSRWYYERIAADRTISLLFDADSLWPKDDQWPRLSRLPPGRYRATVVVPRARRDPTTSEDIALTSQEVSFLLRDPAVSDQDFLERVQKDPRLKHTRRLGISWVNVLEWGIDLALFQPEAVSVQARRQMGLHELMSRFLSGHAPVSPQAIEEVRSLPVLPYLEPERDLLLIELRRATDLAGPEELTEFLGRHPDIARRIENIKGRDSGFVAEIKRQAEWRERVRQEALADPERFKK